MHELIKLSVLFFIIFGVGYVLSAYLYKKQNKAFAKSGLQTKVLMWVPIFLLFLLFMLGSNWVRLAILAYIYLYIAKELIMALKLSPNKWLVSIFSAIVCTGLFLLLVIYQQYTAIVIVIGFSSVLSDVFAFFMGNFWGRHQLPKAINPGKSWEGVFGQIIGAAFGVFLVNIFVVPVNFWLFLPIGIGSAFGDIVNSYIKRKYGVKDWGSTLPGHGGFLDRFASLSFATLLVMLCIFAFDI